MRKTLLIVFAKAPDKGKVKTRLGKNIGMKKSQGIYIQLLYHTAKVTRKSKIETILFANKSDDTLESIFYHSKKNKLQKGKNLGEKMENAFLWAFKKSYEKVILIGSDLFSLKDNILIEAQQALENFDLVIGPSYDGGYYLIGMKKMNNKIFKGIPWSTNEVLCSTEKKIKEKKIYYLEIAKDVDDFNDLKAHPSLYKIYKKNN